MYKKQPQQTNTGRRRGPTDEGEDLNTVKRVASIKEDEATDLRFGYSPIEQGGPAERTGWLVNFEPLEMVDEEKRLVSAVAYYFLQADGSRFKCTLPYKPYLFVLVKSGTENEVSSYLGKKYSALIAGCELVVREDLDQPNHLIGLTRTLIKLSFININHLNRVKGDLLPVVRANQDRLKAQDTYTTLLADALSGGGGGDGAATGSGGKPPASKRGGEQTENILQLREYDVPYHVRVSIDLNIFVGKWYRVKHAVGLSPTITLEPELIDWAEPVVLAFDIETSKLPLKFPDANIDQVIMISYMVDGQGFLITNQEIVSEEVLDFEYTPKPEFQGPFTVFNMPDEQAVLHHFFQHVRQLKPHVFATYNGDFFDWPFIERRAQEYGLDLNSEIGFFKDTQGEYKSHNAIHMDCLCWVRRDSYLPVGSQNLKACTKAKLRYDPVELDPEEMCQLARSNPQVLANYSVSDAVATYYLYMKYVHPFIFALSTIIPMKPDEVLRKGSGTLCEALLMVKAFHINILFPNKHTTQLNKLTQDGHVLDNETYVGGHVEALECGVFRSNIPCRFRTVPEAFQNLINTLDSTLHHAIVNEEGVPLDQVTNYSEMRDVIKRKLESLRDMPSRMEHPMIYHLDVGAMYPNIILTNRLQPPAVIDDSVCATCDFNRPGAQCQRKMAWVWRGDVMPANRNELHKVQYQLETEKFPPLVPGGPIRAYHQLTREERANAEKKRLAEYCRKAYKKTKVTKEEVRYSTICQRENSFYVDTVRAFRDRRYELKGLTKEWKKKLAQAQSAGDVEAIKGAKSKEVLYDSLQLAHKCILNSFYGYVMRKGSRWFSMEMAGIVCHTGANIIKQARQLLEQIGRPLELDTDGIWCMLPASFPENYTFHTTLPKKSSITVSYPGAMLNVLVQKNFTNHQYHEREAPDVPEYRIREENSIFFEVDGPYLAMILPASKEEGKRLKKRYVVFDHDASIAELKGFEVKRRGELQLIKNFQSSVFDAFLQGRTLAQSYEAAARVANYWLDVLFSKAANMPDCELFDLIAENRFMSKSLADYQPGQKSTSISTAKRLAEFLGDQMVKDAGLACKFVISRQPENAPVTDRAVPLAIFQAEPAVRSYFLNKWLKSSHAASSDHFDIRDVLDWEYYIERLGSCVQKIVTIPAAMQGISNPVPRVPHPDWLQKRLVDKQDMNKQKRINEMFFAAAPKPVADIESLAGENTPAPQIKVSKKRKLEMEQTEQLERGWREVLGEPPAIGVNKEDLLKWVAFHKKKWAHQISQRKHRHLMRSSNKKQNMSASPAPQSGKTGQPTTALGSFVRQTQNAVMNMVWQIIQLKPLANPGLFKAWVLIGCELHAFRISVPRIFFVNQMTPKSQERGELWRRTQKYLPRAHPTYSLYQYCVPEAHFLTHSSELQVDFSSPQVEGVYELQVPLLFRLLTYIGCCANLNKHVVKSLIGRPSQDCFDIMELTERTLADCSYLDEDECTVHKLFLFQFVVPAGDRGVYALFFPSVSGSGKAAVLIVDPSGTNSMPNLQSLYHTEYTNKSKSGDQKHDTSPADLSLDGSVYKDVEAANKALNKLLQQYKTEHRGRVSLLCYQANHFELLEKLTGVNDFPLVNITVEDAPNLLNGLEWQKTACKFAVKHFLSFPLRYKSLVEHARYLHIPVGNMPTEDLFNFSADLLFARHLRKHNHLLWLSHTGRPDFGGKEADDHRLVSNMYDNMVTTQVNNPGLYQGMCVELELSSVPVAAILQSHHVNDMEGGAADSVSFDLLPAQHNITELISGGGDNPASNPIASYDESVLCSHAFRILKTMLLGWVREVSVWRNEWADLQLVHFYRWLTNPASLLHDPALTRIVASLMQKLLLQLVAEFSRLGAQVVLASVNKIILHTNKGSVEDALAYVDFVTKSIHSRDLFHIIDFKPAPRVWAILLWLDSANFGGIGADAAAAAAAAAPAIPDRPDDGDEVTVVGGTENSEQQIETEEQENTEPGALDGNEDREVEVDSNWNMMYYLPEKLQQQFGLLVAGYLITVLNKATQLKTTNVGGHRDTCVVENSQGKEVISTVESSLREFCQSTIQSEVTHKIVSVLHRLKSTAGRNSSVSAEPFPALPGSHLKLQNGGLEFVKMVCHVLALDPTISEQVDQMRKTVLRIINVGQFSDQVHFTDPSLSFVLREVICKQCNYCRDVDLCRDLTLNFQGGPERLGVWRCVECGAPYDVGEIEMSVVEQLHNSSVAFVLQDLTCAKCHGVKQLNMNLHCQCSGVFHYSLAKDRFNRQLLTFRNLATHYNMTLLAQTLAWTTQMYNLPGC